MPSESSSRIRSSPSACGNRCAYMRASGRGSRPSTPVRSRSRPAAAWKRQVGGVRFAVCRINLRTRILGPRGELTNHAALADSRRPDHAYDASIAVDRPLEYTVERAHLPLPPNECRLGAICPPAGRHPEQTVRRYRILGTLDVNQFGVTEHGGCVHQPCRRVTHHDPARRRHRLHPLRHPDLFTDCGVGHWAGADFAGDHLTGVESDPQLQGDLSTRSTSAASCSRVGLNVERRTTCAHGVVLECDRRPEHGHDAVAGELVHRPAVALHDHRRAAEHLAHDLAQPLRPDGRGDVHRAHDIGEQHGDLLVLGVAVRGTHR